MAKLVMQAVVCPHCKGKGTNRTKRPCRLCLGEGYLPPSVEELRLQHVREHGDDSNFGRQPPRNLEADPWDYDERGLPLY